MGALIVIARVLAVGASAAVLCALCGPMRPAAAEPAAIARAPAETFWTWSKLEPDTVATAWLLRRFAAPGCAIELVPRGETRREGVPFDMPFVELTRTRDRSTFHVVRQARAIADARVLALERLIDEIEVGGWDALPQPRAEQLERELRTAIDAARSPQIALDDAAVVLDRWYSLEKSAEEN